MLVPVSKSHLLVKLCYQSAEMVIKWRHDADITDRLREYI